MRLNNDQLRIRARELALRSDVAQDHAHTRTFWPNFKHAASSLHSLAMHLSHKQVLCAQPAEGWLLDHIAFIQIQAQAVLRQMPRAVFHRLPRLLDNGMPRIYALCQDYLEQVDGCYDTQAFEQYLEAYQEVSVLTTLECWLLPSAMRVVIINQLAQFMREVRHRHEVCAHVHAVLTPLKSSAHSRQAVYTALNRMVGGRRLNSAEVVHLVRHLNEWEPDMGVVRDWLSTYVDSHQMNLEELTSFEHQFAAHLQAVCGDLITSLHTLERQPWRDTFVKISQVDKVLQGDSHGEYHLLDRSSQDLLRNQVEKIASRLHLPETLIAHSAVHLAQKNVPQNKQAGRQNHFAYYLLDPEGIRELTQALTPIQQSGWHPALMIRRHAFPAYGVSLAVLFVMLISAVAYWTTRQMVIAPWSWVIIFLALVLPVSEWAVTLVHMAIMQGYPTRLLLRYDFSKMVPDDARTMVVIPIIWSRPDDVDDVITRLEVHYLANPQLNTYFAILADFEDGPAETMPGDSELVTYAISQIDRLRAAYGTDRFFLFHRARRFNPSEGIFMGWERKRGKLVELVELLSGRRDTSFTTVHGNTHIFQTIRYVFTVDHDTKLPLGVVARMIGTIHFPYNRPRLNSTQTRVVEGFGLVQPRVAISFDAAHSSRLAAIWSGEPGIDPYTMAVSHPYR